MGNRFKKVSETQQIPDTIDRALFKPSSVQEDPYAHLSATAEARRAALMREAAGYHEELEAAAQKPWERLSSAQTLTARKFSPGDEALSNLQPEDVSVAAIRRASYDTDSDALSFRPHPGDTFNDPIATALRGASLWMGDTNELDLVLGEMADKDNMLFDQRTAKDRKQTRHSQWEEEKMAEMGRLRPSQFSSSRAHQIVKAHHEAVAAGRFGLMDQSMLDAHEAERLEMAENRRAQRLAIKDKHILTREERNAQWEQNAAANLRPKRLQDMDISWGDELTRLVTRK
jgi:hypothetical protein